jgi:hypothetical protein
MSYIVDDVRHIYRLSLNPLMYKSRIVDGIPRHLLILTIMLDAC